MSKPNTPTNRIANVLRKIGYDHSKKITDTLQGSIWMANSSKYSTTSGATRPQSAVFKVASRYLHEQKMALIDGKTYAVDEDILMEKSILKFLTQTEECPDSITKFLQFFKTTNNYVLMMENGGSGLFRFIEQAHNVISKGKIEISEWHRVVKVIFKQMIESIEYIHSKNVCHFDVSLENFLINDVQIELDQNKNGKIKFVTDDIRVKLCDFGLAQLFTKSECLSSKYCGKTAYKSPEIIGRKKRFDAKKNDIWCLGICLFMMLFGGNPFRKAHESEDAFVLIMNGQITKLLEYWGKLQGVNDDLVGLFNDILKYEQDRMDLNVIKQNRWLNQ